ncbi:MAG: CPBP family intramembrane glutamic endopeptidase [Pyrobaculum sp.]
MRLVALALSIPAMFIAMGVAALLAPNCVSASLAVAYLVLTPLIYYARPFAFRPKYFAISLLVFTGLWGLELVLQPLLRQYDSLLQVFIQTLSTCPQWKLYFSASAVVLAPLVEETIFRAMLYTELEKRAGQLVGYVGNSLIFAAVHGAAALLPLYFAYGLVLTYAFKKGGIAASMALHGLNNLVALLPILLGG